MMTFNSEKRKNSLILVVLMFLAFGHDLIGGISTSNDDEIPITPNDEFFKVAIDFFNFTSEDYRLIVTGAVNQTLNLTLAEIKAMPVTTEIVRLTCVEYAYAKTLTGVANWTGVKLSYILELAEIDLEQAVDISFHTLDTSSYGYSSSLKPEEAFWDDVILAYEMNEVPLPKEHGYPIRLVCPRFFGYKWIKWLVTINVRTEEYIGLYPSRGYSDSPFVDVELPIYYPLGSGTVPYNPSQKKTDYGLELFFAALAALTYSRLKKKKVE
jgi:DMSO/TMAO reductase YedYZ molybdopterin-dependent catalytic subunit